nr:tail fiber domain-containing protein [uncultured Sphingomonas sp.]
MVDVVKVVVTNARGPVGGVGPASGPLGAESVTAATIKSSEGSAIAQKIGAMRPGGTFVTNFPTSITPSAPGLLYFNADLGSTFDLFRYEGTIKAGASSYLQHVTASSEAGATAGGAVGLAMSGPGAVPTLVVNRYESGNASALLVNKVGTGNRYGIEANFSSTGNGGAAFFIKQNSGSGGGAGIGPAVEITNISDSGLAIRATTSENNGELTSNVFERRNAKIGTNLDVQILTGGARTGVLTNQRSLVQPATPSTGTFAVTAYDVVISANVQGSSSAVGVSVSNAATGGANSYGAVFAATGTNTTNYGVFANALNGTNNWSGYFVGNVFIGGTLTNPSDKRLKTVHGEVDGAEALEAVRSGKVYRYDKFLDRKKERLAASNEIGPIAQELRKVSPDHVTAFKGHDKVEILGVNDRSELYQLKAAVAHLAEIVETLTPKPSA